jgi:hypothetical protein
MLEFELEHAFVLDNAPAHTSVLEHALASAGAHSKHNILNLKNRQLLPDLTSPLFMIPPR